MNVDINLLYKTLAKAGFDVKSVITFCTYTNVTVFIRFMKSDG